MIFWLSLLLTAHLSFANNTIEDLEEASNVSLEASFSKIPLPHRVQKRFEHVQKLVFSGPTSTKVYLLKRNIEDDPSHIDSYLLLAKTFIDENMEFGKLPVESKVDRARDLITEGLKINPKSQSLWIMHANLQIRKDLVETNKALRIVHLLGEIKKLDDLLRLARTHNILKDRTKMEFYHNEAKKYLVTSIDKYKYHFQVALLSLDHKFAVDNYYEAEKYRPDYETNWIYVNIPHHLKQLNRFDEAIEMAKKGIKISQNAALVVLSSALLARGHDYVTKNNIEAGTADFLESFKYNKMSGGFSGLARIAAMRRDFVKAQELLIEGVPFHEGEIG